MLDLIVGLGIFSVVYTTVFVLLVIVIVVWILKLIFKR